MAAHALLSPSSSTKWLNCANSLAAEQHQPKDESSPASQAGTDRHELLEMCLENHLDAGSYFGSKLKSGVYVDQDMVDDVQVAATMITDRVAEYTLAGYKVEMKLEVRVPIGHITGEFGATGSADVVLVCTSSSDNLLVVVDAKFGFYPVEVAKNSQLSMYAIGALVGASMLFDEVVLAIAQPKVSSQLSTWFTTPAKLEEWRSTVASPAAKKARMVLLEDGPLRNSDFAPGAACKWCRAKPVCPALLETVKAAVVVDFEDLTKTDTTTLLTDDDLGELYPQLDLIDSWVSAVKGRVLSRMTLGHAVPGLKLVAGKRGHRTWSDPDEVEAMLKKMRVKTDDMYSKKLLGPKPILDLVASNPRQLRKLEDLVVQRDGQPSVAFESSGKEAIVVVPVIDEFTAYDDVIEVAVTYPDDFSDLL